MSVILVLSHTLIIVKLIDTFGCLKCRTNAGYRLFPYCEISHQSVYRFPTFWSPSVAPKINKVMISATMFVRFAGSRPSPKSAFFLY